jgi:hypothetical protein
MNRQDADDSFDPVAKDVEGVGAVPELQPRWAKDAKDAKIGRISWIPTAHRTCTAPIVRRRCDVHGHPWSL